MFQIKSKKVRKVIAATVASAVTLCSMTGVTKVFASDITAGSWGLHYYSPAADGTFDYVTLTVRDVVYSSRCSTLSNKNMAVSFTNNSIVPAGDGVLIHTSTGTKRFKFSGVGNGKDYNVKFYLIRSQYETGSAQGSAKKGTY